MDPLEREYINRFLKGLSLSYVRVIDDIFFVWIVSKNRFIPFLNKLNTKHDSTKFEYQILKSKMSILDTNVYSKRNKFYKNIYLRKKDTQRLHHVSLEHNH